MARPLKKINEAQVYKLSRIGCTTAEIATILETSPDTLERRFAVTLRKGREKMKSSLRRMQYRVAMTRDRTMLIWLGKQYLGQKESDTTYKIDLDKLTNEQLLRLANGEHPASVLANSGSGGISPQTASGEHIN